MTLSGRAPSRIRTAEVLACFDETPKRIKDAAEQLGHPQALISGHITFLHKVGKLARVARGMYVRTAWGQC